MSLVSIAGWDKPRNLRTTRFRDWMYIQRSREQADQEDFPELIAHNDLCPQELFHRLSNVLDLWGCMEIVGSQPRLGRPVVRHGLSVSGMTLWE